MVKFNDIPNTMQIVIKGKHYIVDKNTDFTEEEAKEISQHLGLVLEGKSSKQVSPQTTTSKTFSGSSNK